MKVGADMVNKALDRVNQNSIEKLKLQNKPKPTTPKNE